MIPSRSRRTKGFKDVQDFHEWKVTKGVVEETKWRVRLGACLELFNLKTTRLLFALLRQGENRG